MLQPAQAGCGGGVGTREEDGAARRLFLTNTRRKMFLKMFLLFFLRFFFVFVFFFGAIPIFSCVYVPYYEASPCSFCFAGACVLL